MIVILIMFLYKQWDENKDQEFFSGTFCHSCYRLDSWLYNSTYGAGHWKKHPTIRSEGTYFDNKSHGISESISLQKIACFLFAL